MRSTILAIVAATIVGACMLVCLEYRKPPQHRFTGWCDSVVPPPPEVQASQQRASVKRALARRVIAERIPLLEAVEMFREANGADGLHHLIAGVTGRTVREKLCVQVIQFVLLIEPEMETAGQLPTGPRPSAVLQDDFARCTTSGEFLTDPAVE